MWESVIVPEELLQYKINYMTRFQLSWEIIIQVQLFCKAEIDVRAGRFFKAESLNLDTCKRIVFVVDVSERLAYISSITNLN